MPIGNVPPGTHSAGCSIMKKYARLRSTSSHREYCEPCGEGNPGVTSSTTLSLDDDGDAAAAASAAAAPGKWNTVKLSPPAHHGSNHDYEVDASSSSSHRVLADALKKLSSLRTHHDLDEALPQCGSAARDSWGAGTVSDSDAGEPPSFFSAGKWQRPRCALGAEVQPSSYRISSHYSIAGAGRASTQGNIIHPSEFSCCTHTSHKFTHRRSSSMHDVTTSLGGQPAATILMRPTTSTAKPISGHTINPRPPGTACLATSFQNGQQQWSPPQLRFSTASASAAAAAAPPARRQQPPGSASSLQSKSGSLWEESSDDPKSIFVAGRSTTSNSGKRANAVQSMRYDRLHSNGPMEVGELQSQSVREGAAHAQAIAAMAKAYAEKYGVAQAVVECVACGRGLGVIVEGSSPGSYDSSFCRSCRPPVLPVHAAAASWKKGASGVSRGMMHYCRKLLVRMVKKPGPKYSMV